MSQTDSSPQAGGPRLEGKIAVVTGAGSGIGRATVELFAAHGAAIVAVDIREPRLNETVDALRADGHQAIGFRADVSRDDEVEAAIAAAVAEYGRIDVLYNKAGTAKPGTPTELSVEDWQRVIDVNLTSVFLGVRHAAPVMAAGGGGSIISTASVSGIRGDESNFAYNAAKAGVVNVTKGIAIDLAPDNIRVNCICPGAIETPPMEWIYVGDEQKAAATGAHVLDRFGQPGEIASAALFLASDDSSFVTGHALVVDGGLTVQTNLPPLQPPPARS